MYVASDGIRTVAILPDRDPMNPRTDWDNVSKMICWHRRYNLGDKHNYADGQEFAMDLVNEHVPQKDIFKFIQEGNAASVHLVADGEFYNVELKTEYQDEPIDLEIRLDKDLNVVSQERVYMKEDVLDSMTTGELLQLASDHVAILPLYLYDHGGITMSTGSFVGRAPHADWDSGQVGFIYLDKETAMKELAMPAQTLRVASIKPAERRWNEFFKTNEGESVAACLMRDGYTHVTPSDVRNLSDPKFASLDSVLESGLVFKKDHILYCLADCRPNDVDVGSFRMTAIAVYNPDLQRLTDDNWKTRALEVLESDVATFDAFLTGEVYGFQAFEGLEEVHSCWGFNYAGEEIRNQLYDMTDGWATPQLCEDMKHASYESGDDFDIDEFFMNNDFPALRGKITEEVRDYIEFEGETSQNYPYGVSAEDLLSNKDAVLDNIVESLYDLHKEITTEDIHSAILDEVGLSREVEPKISVSDLEPGKEYTASEIMNIFNKKPSLADKIAAAKAQTQQPGVQGHTPPEHTH